ncbi:MULTISPECIES: DUF397 domain-containing protein [unclassified Streptomyces]|uniref:DUF397 domain-containing protein n=1 Tax=unclassified Streptomyces TaxID=2593676 RepID=UPI000DAD7EA3|nr:MULTISPECIES: DUF397 domain-containing protein [unclassified Streptomyces]PZT75835.1 DUF397 domain-containing protein [Streptomyces sp. AC1-42W]PZT80212.1 DUF397 domain-containing protein [Streptomyces sp. AC1-42T]
MEKVDEAQWFKSSHSNGNGNCVEVAHLGAAVGVRDSKVQAGPVLTCAVRGWRAFVGSVVRDAR